MEAGRGGEFFYRKKMTLSIPPTQFYFNGGRRPSRLWFMILPSCCVRCVQSKWRLTTLEQRCALEPMESAIRNLIERPIRSTSGEKCKNRCLVPCEEWLLGCNMAPIGRNLSLYTPNGSQCAAGTVVPNRETWSSHHYIRPRCSLFQLPVHVAM